MLETQSFKINAAQELNIQGKVLYPGDAEYDNERQAWNRAFQHSPALIVIASNSQDVVEAVKYANHIGLGVAIQATGHGVSRVSDGSMLIITSQMTSVQVDTLSQTAWVEAGAKWQHVLDKSHPVGLAPLLGSTPDVGAVGYTLGGGYGWLGRKYGLSTDSVIYFEVVTANGNIVNASNMENPDLFWALRGGGVGSLGVVTGMKIQLYPVASIYGGNLYYNVEDAKEVFTRYREWIKTAPDELTSAIAITNFPPVPDVPDFLRGKSFVHVRGGFVGSAEDGEKLLSYWRDWKAPVFDMFAEMPFSDIANISNDPLDPIPALSTGAWLSELSDDAIDTLIKYSVTDNGLIFSEIRHVGGAVSKVDSHANAYGNRDATHLLSIIGVVFTPESEKILKDYTNTIKQELEPFMTGGVYINFLEEKERRERTRDGFLPESFDRLTKIKAKYDPENLFHFGIDIPLVKQFPA